MRLTVFNRQAGLGYESHQYDTLDEAMKVVQDLCRSAVDKDDAIEREIGVKICNDPEEGLDSGRGPRPTNNLTRPDNPFGFNENEL